ncbi:hypothetical protein GM708_10260 [Vibrio cholerae]|nr:hypothetical protein [Vibrio cholerae]
MRSFPHLLRVFETLRWGEIRVTLPSPSVDSTRVPATRPSYSKERIIVAVLGEQDEWLVESQKHGLISTSKPSHGGPSAASLAEQAFFEVKVDVVDKVLQRVVTEGSVGAVLLGVEGSGKTALLRLVAHGAARTHHVVRIWASRSASKDPYRALAFFLAELEPEQTRHPLTILQGIRTLLDEQANGRPVVFAIDNAEYLDPESVLVITRLAMAGKSTVVIAAESLRTLDDSFSDLWREGELERFDLPCLTREEIRAIAAAALGAPVSSDAITEIWQATEGNARFLGAALEELPQSRLVLQAGAWVSATGCSPVSSAVRDHARATLAHLHPRAAFMVRALAFAGSLEAGAVRRLAGMSSGGSDAPAHGKSEGVDLLDALHPLTVPVGEGAMKVSLASELFAAAVREQTTAAEAAALYASVTGPASAALDPGALDALMHAEWLLAAGLDVPENLRLASAKRCTSLGLSAQALFWSSLHPGETTLERLIEAARCAVNGGHDAKVEALLIQAAGFAAADDAPVGPTVDLLILQAGVLRRNGAAAHQRTALLDHADGRLDAAERRLGPACTTDRDVLVRRGALTIARAEEAAFSGDYQGVLALVQGSSRTGWTREQRVLADGLLCEAFALTDRQNAAAGLAHELTAELGQHPVLDRSVSDATRLRLAVVRYAVGYAGTTPEAPPMSAPAVAGPDTLGDLIAGVEAALQGRTDEARELLFTAARQLERGDPYGLLPLAAAAHAYSQAEADPAGSALGYLPLAQGGRRMPWAAAAFINQIQLSSAGLREPRKETAAKLGELAEEARVVGVPMIEMTHRLAQLRAGDVGAAAALAGVAGSLEGSYAAACSAYARAVSSRDAELFVRAMELAELAGQTGLARGCATQAIQTAQLSGSRAVQKEVRRRAGQLFGDITDMQLDAVLERLTKREREVAQLAARGESNKYIATTMGVTTRTVEGHLYQIYSKLHLRARSELADLIPVGER